MLNWQGDQVKNKVLAAAGRAINSVLSDCVKMAKAIHPPQVRTGTFQGSIQMRPAVLITPLVVAGFFGSYSTNYGIYLELGTKYIQEYAPLRKSADIFFPELGSRIRSQL